jgi:hypothetical protein
LCRENNHVPKQVQEPKGLNDHPNYWPLEHNDDKDASNEAHAPSYLVLPSEEVKRLLRTDDERDSGKEEHLRKR